ncbi:MAG: hypothetical protein GQ574_17180 [Crocinitomix sp.]|nr:hypothetical protein [Crocinitomix sp.]
MTQKTEQASKSTLKPYQFKLKAVLIWGALLVLGLILKAIEWPLDGVLIVSGSAAITAYALHHIFRSKGKDSLNNAILSLAIIWLAILIWGVFFNAGYPYNKYGLQFYSYCFVIVFLIYEVVRFVKLRKK